PRWSPGRLHRAGLLRLRAVPRWPRRLHPVEAGPPPHADKPIAPAFPAPVANLTRRLRVVSSGVIETLLARGLIADDPRFGGRGRPSFLVTTTAFLRLVGLGSLA